MSPPNIPTGADPEAGPAESARLARSAALIGALTSASRVLGVLRDALQAAVLGAGAVADAFVIAWTVPNLVRRILGEGALTAAFVPIFQRVREREGEAASLRLAGRVFWLLVAGLALLAGAGIAGALAWRAAVAPGDPEREKLRLALALTALLLPFMALVCGTSLLAAAMNALGRFGVPALPPILQNAVVIGGLAVAFGLGEAAARAALVSVAILVGATVGLAVVAVSLARCGMAFRPEMTPRDPGVREVGGLLGPVVLGLMVVQANVLVDRLIAEVCIAGDGPVAALYYGHQLFELPLGVLAVAVATAAFPELARLGARGDLPALGDGVARALRLVAALAFPAAAGLAAVREPTVRFLFERGLFTPEDSARTAAVTFWYALAVAPAALSPVLARAHHARADTRTPVRIALVAVAANLALNLVLVWPMREAGLACATAISCSLQAALLAGALRGRVPVPWKAGVFPAAGRALAATAVSAAAAWGALAVSGTAAPVLRCAGGVGAGVTAYVAVALALGSAEVRALIFPAASRRSS